MQMILWGISSVFFAIHLYISGTSELNFGDIISIIAPFMFVLSHLSYHNQRKLTNESFDTVELYKINSGLATIHFNFQFKAVEIKEFNPKPAEVIEFDFQKFGGRDFPCIRYHEGNLRGKLLIGKPEKENEIREFFDTITAFT